MLSPWILVLILVGTVIYLFIKYDEAQNAPSRPPHIPRHNLGAPLTDAYYHRRDRYGNEETYQLHFDPNYRLSPQEIAAYRALESSNKPPTIIVNNYPAPQAQVLPPYNPSQEANYYDYTNR
jgi:hypothetical protein